MKPETETSEWTVDTLKEYFEARLYANETALDAAKTSSDSAITAAKEGNEIALYAEKQNRDIALGIAREAAFKAIDAAKDSLTERLKNGDDQLLVHIEAQKVAVATALISLKDLLLEKDKATEMFDKKQSEALGKADIQLQRRLDEINHSRAQALSERASYLTRDMHEAAVAEIRHQMERNRDDLNKALLKETYETAAKELGIWRTEVNEFKTKIEGRGEGVSSSAKSAMYALTAISLIIGLFSAAIAWRNNSNDTTGEVRYNSGRIEAIERQTTAPVTVTNPPEKPVPTQQRP